MSTAVVTLTAAGAIDATYRVGMLERGAFTRATAYEREVSGKGVNVSAALHLGGRRTAAVVVLGEDDVDFAARSPHARLLRVVPVPGATRVNTSVIDDGGATTKVNAPTPPVAAERWDAAVAAVIAAWEELDAGWLVVSGTLPTPVGGSAPVEIADLLRAARDAGVRVAVDSSGEALARAVADPAGVDLVKPNTHELAELVGRPLRTVGDVTAAAREVIARGIGIVFTSMGADGVLVVTEGGAVHAHATARSLVNTAGAGDASLAGFLVGLGDGGAQHPDALERAARTAAAYGAHAVAASSTILPGVDDLPDAWVTRDPDPATPLREPAI